MRSALKFLSLTLGLVLAASCSGERPDFAAGQNRLDPDSGATGTSNTPDAGTTSSLDTDESNRAVSTDGDASETGGATSRRTEDSGEIASTQGATHENGNETEVETSTGASTTDAPEPDASDSTADTQAITDGPDTDTTDAETASDASTVPEVTDSTVAAPELVSVALVLAKASLSALNDGTSFEVLCTFDNDDTIPCSGTASFNVEDPGIVELDTAANEFVALTNGTTEVTAIVDGMDLGAICNTLRLTGAATGATGTSVTWTAVCDYDDGRTGVDVSRDVAWQTSSSTVASISNAGVLTAVSLGSATISATLDNPDETTATVNRAFVVTRGVLVSIAISAIDATQVPAGRAVNFSADCVYTDMTTDCTTAVTWTSSAPVLATFADDGTATGHAAGTTTITANQSGISSNALTLRVTAPVLASVAVTPNSGVTAEVNTSRQLTATCVMSDGTSSICTPDVTWSSAPSNIAAIESSGRLFGLVDGSTQVTATRQGVSSGAVSVTIVPPAGCEAAIDFPDDVMLQDVRDITGRTAGSIYYEDVKAITSFEHHQDNGFLAELKGIHCFTSLETLIVERAWLEDLSDIIGLIHLKTLRVGFTSVTSVPDLTLLTELSEVDLSYTQITDLEALIFATQLGSGDSVSVTNTNLDCLSSWTIEQIETLEGRGVSVVHNCGAE